MTRRPAIVLALSLGLPLLLAGCGGDAAPPATTTPAANPRHFSGRPAESWDQAITHLRDGKATLAELLARETLGPNDLHQVHELTYTLENALERMRGELAAMAETLEAVHVASESNDSATVARGGRRFLADLDRVVP